MKDEFLTPVYPWVPDRGDGTYCNPVICADYSDPDVVRVGGEFWLTASSFNCVPGLPILHSKDLVNWRIVGYALKEVPGEQYRVPQHGCGVWAPAIRFQGGKYYIFFPTPDEGIYVVTADDPTKGWSEPKLILPGKGLIDPCPLWDEDGKAYLVHAYAKSRAGIKDILRVRPMAGDGMSVLGEGKVVYSDPGRQPTLEGPKFLKRNGWYYISAPAGGVPTGWQLILRAREVWGPYEEKIVLAQGGTPVNGPHQGALVDTAGGQWWFVHFQEALPFGRIVHLQPVEWVDDWPMIGRKPEGAVDDRLLAPGLAVAPKFTAEELKDVRVPVGRWRKPEVVEKVAVEVPQTSDDFSSGELGLQWQWHANSDAGWWSMTARTGRLRLYAHKIAKVDFVGVPNLLLQKLPAKGFSVETRVEFSPGSDEDRAGLIVMGLEHAAVVVRRQGEDVGVYYVVNNAERLVSHIEEKVVELRAVMGANGETTFAYRAGGGEWEQASDRAFAAKPGRWIGAKVGVFCLSTGESQGYGDFEYFRFGAGAA